METPPNKRKWGKKLVTDSVNLYWTLKLKDKVNSKATLNYLNVDDVMIGKTHNVDDVMIGKTHNVDDVMIGKTHNVDDVMIGKTHNVDDVMIGKTHNVDDVMIGKTHNVDDKTHNQNSQCR